MIPSVTTAIVSHCIQLHAGVKCPAARRHTSLWASQQIPMPAGRDHVQPQQQVGQGVGGDALAETPRPQHEPLTSENHAAAASSSPGCMSMGSSVPATNAARFTRPRAAATNRRP